MKRNKIIYLVLVVLITGFVVGCGVKSDDASKPSKIQPETDSGTSIALWVTRDFGRSVLLKKEVECKKNASVFDVLNENTKVTTAYGGGFVESINGLKSKNNTLTGERYDWFYYVNGIFADVGALDYVLHNGEVIWWDYHPWSTGISTPAVIGCYPEPFLHGYNGKVKPTIIMSTEGNTILAGSLEKALEAQGVASVNIKPLDENLLKNRQGPTIVIGEWAELKKIPWLEDLNNAYKKNGTFIHFINEGVELTDYNGTVVKEIDQNAGAILATGEGSGDDAPLWVITGTDQESLRQALDLLIKTPDKISGVYNAVIISGEIIRLPLQ